MKRGERPLTQLPMPIVVIFLVFVGLQLLTHLMISSQNSVRYQPLSTPFSAPVYQGLSLGSPHLLSYLLAMRLQLHDNQAGKHVPYHKIDYAKLVQWLEQIYKLNIQSEYPMMLASRVYSQTQDKARLRILLDYIDRTFAINPQLHWRRLAEASVIAKHQLGDLKLALKMARSLSTQPQSIDMPHWARDIHFLLLGDLNEFEAVIAIISALIQSDSIADPDERRFLQEKLLYFQQKLSEYRQKSSNNSK